MTQFDIWIGIVALCCSMIVGISDMVLSGQPVSGAEHTKLGLNSARGKSARALQLAGFAGIANIFVALGFWQWYRALAPAGFWLSVFPILLLVIFFLLGVTVHFIWPILATLSLAAEDAAPESKAAIQQLYDTTFQRYFVPLGMLAVPLLLGGSIWFAVAVLSGRTLFPQWFAILSPAFPVLSLYALSPRLPAPIGGYIRANFLHIIIPVLFAISSWTLASHVT